MKMKPKVGNVITATSMVVAVIALTISAVLFVLSANQHHTNASLTVSYVATNVYVEVDAKYQKKLDASPTALTGGPLTFQPTGVSSTGTLSAGDIVLSPNDNYVLFTYSFKNKATVGGYDIAVTLTDTVNRVNTKVYYSYNDTSTAMSTMATNMTNSRTTTAPQNITIPAQQTKYLYIYVEIDDWYFGASYTSDASHFLRFDITSTMIDFENDYQVVDYIESTGTQWIDTGVQYNSENDYIIFQELESHGIAGDYSVGSGWNGGGAVWEVKRDWYDGLKTRPYTSDQRVQVNIHIVSGSDSEYTWYNVDTNESCSSNRESLLHTYGSSNYPLLTSTDSNGIASKYNMSAKLYGARISVNNTLVRNLIPCYRKSDNKPGLYDTVNGVFYTNRGTGEFLLPS